MLKLIITSSWLIFTFARPYQDGWAHYLFSFQRWWFQGMLIIIYKQHFFWLIHVLLTVQPQRFSRSILFNEPIRMVIERQNLHVMTAFPLFIFRYQLGYGMNWNQVFMYKETHPNHNLFTLITRSRVTRTFSLSKKSLYLFFLSESTEHVHLIHCPGEVLLHQSYETPTLALSPN